MRQEGPLEGVPRSIRLLCSGGAAIVGVVAVAVAVRPPLDEAQALAASFDGPEGTLVTGSSAAPSSAETAPAPPRPRAEPKRSPPTPQPTAALPAFEPPSGNARELRTKLTKDLQTGNYRAAVGDIDALMTTEPSTAEDRDIRNLIVDLAMRIMVGAGPEVEQLFNVVTQKMGTHGGDILFELVTTRGGSRAARRADELLKDPAVFARGSPAMRIAYELRTASCDKKPELFERAQADGDGRTLGQLQQLNQDCYRGQCCMRNDPKLKEAIAVLRARLGQ
jgi:hypothetical protein